MISALIFSVSRDKHRYVINFCEWPFARTDTETGLTSFTENRH